MAKKIILTEWRNGANHEVPVNWDAVRFAREIGEDPDGGTELHFGAGEILNVQEPLATIEARDEAENAEPSASHRRYDGMLEAAAMGLAPGFAGYNGATLLELLADIGVQAETDGVTGAVVAFRNGAAAATEGDGERASYYALARRVIAACQIIPTSATSPDHG